MSAIAAVQANINSMRNASLGNKSDWLALFRDDAVVRDPVGKSPFDAVGDGHKGIRAIESFWDTVIGPANLTLTPVKRYPSGDRHCAVEIRIENDLGNDLKTRMDMMVTYEVDGEGKIKELAAYWSWDEMTKQLEELGVM
jgi:steroid delta-isomerase